MTLRATLLLVIASSCATPATSARSPEAPPPAPAPPVEVVVVEVDAGVPDAGPPPPPQELPPAPEYVSMQLEKCAAGTRFLTLAEVMKAPPTGPFSLRAPLWKRPTKVCTAGEPPYCVRYLVLAQSRMTERNEATLAHLDVVGNVAAGVPFACTGADDAQERCPLVVDGRVYGLTGTMSGSGFLVRSVCRF